MKLYVGTYSKYNDDSLFGEWLDLNDYSNIHEFYEACRELHSDESDPEFMFQDYDEEYNGEGDIWYSESSISEKYWEFQEALKESSIPPEVIIEYLRETGSDNIQDAEDNFCGSYDCYEGFIREIYDLSNIPSCIECCIDWGQVRKMSDEIIISHDGQEYIFNN